MYLFFINAIAAIAFIIILFYITLHYNTAIAAIAAIAVINAIAAIAAIAVINAIAAIAKKI